MRAADITVGAHEIAELLGALIRNACITPGDRRARQRPGAAHASTLTHYLSGCRLTDRAGWSPSRVNALGRSSAVAGGCGILAAPKNCSFDQF